MCLVLALVVFLDSFGASSGPAWPPNIRLVGLAQCVLYGSNALQGCFHCPSFQVGAEYE